MARHVGGGDVQPATLLAQQLTLRVQQSKRRRAGAGWQQATSADLPLRLCSGLIPPVCCCSPPLALDWPAGASLRLGSDKRPNGLGGAGSGVQGIPSLSTWSTGLPSVPETRSQPASRCREPTASHLVEAWRLQRCNLCWPPAFPVGRAGKYPSHHAVFPSPSLLLASFGRCPCRCLALSLVVASLALCGRQKRAASSLVPWRRAVTSPGLFSFPPVVSSTSMVFRRSSSRAAVQGEKKKREPVVAEKEKRLKGGFPAPTRNWNGRNPLKSGGKNSDRWDREVESAARRRGRNLNQLRNLRQRRLSGRQ
jgi:hypothetical protein